MKATYDPEARALYLRITDEPVRSSVEVGDDFVVDLDAEGSVVGVEALYAPMTRQELDDLAAGFGFEIDVDEAWLQVWAAQPIPPTRSGSSISFTTIYYPGTAPFVAGASSAELVIDSDDFELIPS